MGSTTKGGMNLTRKKAGARKMTDRSSVEVSRDRFWKVGRTEG
jgi:hypothetical protein